MQFVILSLDLFGFQFANIGPLAYAIGHKLAPNTVKELPTIYIIITIGATSCLLLVFFWDVTSYIGGCQKRAPAISSIRTL